MQQKTDKKFFVSVIIQSELVLLNCPYEEQDTFHQDVDFNSALTRVPCCFSKGPLKRAFLKIYLTTFPESVISEIQKL